MRRQIRCRLINIRTTTTRDRNMTGQTTKKTITKSISLTPRELELIKAGCENHKAQLLDLLSHGRDSNDEATTTSRTPYDKAMCRSFLTSELLQRLRIVNLS